MKRDTQKKQKGFLLIEMLVALFIFSLVTTVSIGSIVSIIDSNRKNQSLKSVMNNLNLALDSITRYASVGYNYRCTGTTRLREDCSAGGNAFGFTSPYDLDDNGDSPDEVTYTFGDGYIDRAIDDGLGVRITAPEVNISDLTFLVLGSEASNDTEQPKVLIFVSGSTVAGPRLPPTDFKIQTVVSQRLPDINDL